MTELHEFSHLMASKSQNLPVRHDPLHAAKLLIVDDEVVNTLLLEGMLEQAGYYNFLSVTDPRKTADLVREYVPDIILLDLMMPEMDGIAVMEHLRAQEVHAQSARSLTTPILMLTADISSQAKRRALSKGAKDFLTKPFDAIELLLRIGNLLETRFLQLDMENHNQSLEAHVQARTLELEAARQRIANYAHQLEESQVETLDRLAKAGEYRDDDTGQHTQRVGVMTMLLAKSLNLPSDHVHWIQQAARLHDIGKIGISDLILLKPGKLTEDEFEIMKTHTTIGAKLIDGGKSELFHFAHRIAASHHERWDGNGYPEGLRGEDIPLEARLLSVADVFDALTHSRPYKTAWTVDDAVAEIEKQSGRQFDPRVVEAFLLLPRASLPQ